MKRSRSEGSGCKVHLNSQFSEKWMGVKDRSSKCKELTCIGLDLEGSVYECLREKPLYRTDSTGATITFLGLLSHAFTLWPCVWGQDILVPLVKINLFWTKATTDPCWHSHPTAMQRRANTCRSGSPLDVSCLVKGWGVVKNCFHGEPDRNENLMIYSSGNSFTVWSNRS